MKVCCNDCGHNHKLESNVKKWFRYFLYTILAVILIGALVLQLLGKEF
ncbi:hypothetical protein V5097_09825 [Arenibacter palladensis]